MQKVADKANASITVDTKSNDHRNDNSSNECVRSIRPGYTTFLKIGSTTVEVNQRADIEKVKALVNLRHSIYALTVIGE